MKTEFEKCQKIKKLIEFASGYEDIGLRSKKRPYPELKKIYAKLCRKFTVSSFEVIGDALGGYNHASVVHNINSFDDLLETNGLDFIYIYQDLCDKIPREIKALNEAEEKKDISLTVEKVHQKFKISLIKIIEKGHSIINRKEARIKELESLLEEALKITDKTKEEDLEKFYSVRTEIKRSLLK